jgi:phosphopantetheine--protein transferase-like protein
MPRIARLVNGNYCEKFLVRAFHRTEIEKWRKLREENGNRAVQYLAGRWAVKEALLKGLGVKRIPFPEIIVEQECSDGGEFSRFVVRVEGRAKECVERRKVEEIIVSLSHDGEYSVAYVVMV